LYPKVQEQLPKKQRLSNYVPKQPAQNLKSDSTKKPNTITKIPGTNYYPLVTKVAVPQTVIEPTNQSQTTQEKKKGKPGNGQEQPKAAARNKAKTKTKKDSLPLSDPLIRSLDRKQPEEHTSHHYLVKTLKTLVLAALRLCWVLITQSHSQENYLTRMRRPRQAVKEKKEKWSGRYLNTQQVRLARQLEGQTTGRQEQRRGRVCKKNYSW
jgi:hypothetical protein